jgi:tetratricopeptide (TPR) repeat protein
MVLSFFAYPRSRMYSMILLMTILSLILATLPGERKAGFSMKGIGILILLIGVSGSVASYCRVKGEMHTRKLLISQQQRNFARMIREADKAASWFYPMDLTSTPLAWYKGMAHYYSGNVAEAKRMYEEADRVNPNHLRVLNDLGTTCEKLGERDAAIRYYLRALSITPRSVEVNLNLSAVYFNKRNIDSAYYYIDRIYGLPMSWKEDKDYQAFLKAILYAKAYAFLIHPDDLDSLNSRYPFLDDDKILKAIYEQSKSENQPFTKKLRQFTPLKD